MYPHLYVLISICMLAMVTTSEAQDQVTGEVVKLNREKSIVVVRPSGTRDASRDVTLRMKTLPLDLKVGELVRARGSFHPGDRTRFDTHRLNIENRDPSGVRSRLRRTPRQDDDRPRPVITNPKTFKLPFEPRK